MLDMTTFVITIAAAATCVGLFGVGIEAGTRRWENRPVWRPPTMRSHYNEKRGAWEYVNRFTYECDGVRVVVWDVSQRQADLRYVEWVERMEVERDAA